VAKIVSDADVSAEHFRANAAQMRALVAELEHRRAEAALGGPPRYAAVQSRWYEPVIVISFF
jgi:hypothetical protein